MRQEALASAERRLFYFRLMTFPIMVRAELLSLLKLDRRERPRG